MARFAVDASVVLGWLLREGLTLVDEFWEGLTVGDQVVGPRLLLPECTSVIRENVFAGRIPHEVAQEFVRELLSLPITTCDALAQFGEALDLAERFRHRRAYDMQYVAAAIIEQAKLVTLDGGLRQAAVEVGHPVRLLR